MLPPRGHMASVRYIVNDIDESVSFYRDRLGFAVEKHNPGRFAALRLEDLHLFINAPGAGSAGKAGGDPKPGGWSRFMIVRKNLDSMIDDLRKAGASFRGEVAEAGAGRQILLKTRQGMSSSCSNTHSVRVDLLRWSATMDPPNAVAAARAAPPAPG